MYVAGLAARVTSVWLLCVSAALASPVVVTAQGAVSGVERAGVRAFLGVPYAQPPVGDLRWRAPQPMTPWNSERAATEFAASCFQDEPKPFGPYTAPFLAPSKLSEDCLYLNVWTPAGGKAKRPVYVFIHGGAFQSGGSSGPTHDGTALARRGAVVVSINYRLGIFGFLAHPELTAESAIGTSGNYGLLDMIEALRWVQSNIDRFGGDPNNVTIAGQSAGAAAVGHLLLSPLAEGLFHRAVMESGPVVGVPMIPLPAAAEAGVAAVAQLKLDSIAALRAVPPAEVNKAKSFGTAFPNLDGKVVVANPDQLESRVRNRVPVIAGYNRDEITSADAPQTVEAFKKEVQQRFGELAPRVLQLYPHGNDAEAAQSGAQLNRDRCLASLLLWAEQRAAQGQVVYAYSFERALPAGDPVRFGAFHSAELPYVFGTLDMPGVAATAADRSISTEMQDRWLAFMRSGDPNPKRVAAKWQRANSDVSSIWRIGAGHGASFITADRLAVFREYAAKGGRLGLF